MTMAKDANLNSSLHAKKNRKVDDSLEQAINNEQFTASDKRKVIDLLLSNQWPFASQPIGLHWDQF